MEVNASMTDKKCIRKDGNVSIVGRTVAFFRILS